MSTKLIPIRDKRNGVIADLPEAYLWHPTWAKHFERVGESTPPSEIVPVFTPSEDEIEDYDEDGDE